MPPRYTSYTQSNVSKNWINSLLESDRYKDLFSQGMLDTKLKGKKKVYEEVEKAQKKLKDKAKSKFDPFGLMLSLVNPALGAGYSGLKATSKSSAVSNLSKELKSMLKEKFGDNTGYMQNLYKGTGMDEILKGMKTSSIEDLIKGITTGGIQFGIGKVLGNVGEKFAQPGTAIGSSGEVVSGLKPTNIGFKSPNFLKEGALKSTTSGLQKGLPSVKSFEQALPGGMTKMTPTSEVGFQMPKIDFKLGQTSALPIKPGGLGIKPPSDIFKFTSPQVTGVTPGYFEQAKEIYSPKEISKRSKEFYENIAEKDWLADLIKFMKRQ